MNKAKEYFLFLVNLNQIKPKKAKEIVDKFIKDTHNEKIQSEFNTWFYQNYSEFQTKTNTKGDK